MLTEDILTLLHHKRNTVTKFQLRSVTIAWVKSVYSGFGLWDNFFNNHFYGHTTLLHHTLHNYAMLFQILIFKCWRIRTLYTLLYHKRNINNIVDDWTKMIFRLTSDFLTVDTGTVLYATWHRERNVWSTYRLALFELCLCISRLLKCSKSWLQECCYHQVAKAIINH